MSLNRAGDFIWLIGAMVLVGSALIARRRMPRGRMATMMLVWIAIFAILFGVARWMDRRSEGAAPPSTSLNFT